MRCNVSFGMPASQRQGSVNDQAVTLSISPSSMKHTFVSLPLPLR